MRFLLDQDVYAITARFLRVHGHDVQTAQEAGLSQSPDRGILDAAHRDSRVLITRDRDFGALVFLGGARAGVIYLRMKPATLLLTTEARRAQRSTEINLLAALQTHL